MHHGCQSEVVQQPVMSSFVRKCSYVLGKLFESVIYKLPVTSHWKTYSRACLKEDVVTLTYVAYNIVARAAFLNREADF